MICPYCGKKHGRRTTKEFTRKRLEEHINDVHGMGNIPYESAFSLAESIAGDESDGVFWGIVHELGGT